MALNVTTAVIIPGCKRTASKPSLAQWDQGQILKIEGVDLPQAYQVEFCCRGDTITITQIGNKDGVSIPNSLLQRGETIVGYLVLHEGLDDRETEYWIDIYVKARPSPQDVTPSPEEQSVIDELIAALNAGVDAAEEAQAKAEDAQEAAEAAVTHYPKIEDRYWYVWLDGEWVNTGVKAEGVDGRGIVSVDGEKTSTSGLVDTYTMTVTYTDDTTDTITFTVTNGFSPEVTITPVTHGHQVTITDQGHPEGQTFVILDGEVTEAELDDVKNTLNHKADVIYDTASGDIASFPDGADVLPVKDLTVGIEPVQDLHGYDSPWPAGGGVNKLDTSNTTHNNYNIGNIPNALQPSTTYTFGIRGTTTSKYRLYLGKSSDSNTGIVALNTGYIGSGESVSFDTPADMTEYDILVIAGNNSSAGGEDVSVLKPMVSLGSTAPSSWTPYSNICPISGRTGCEVNRTGVNLWDEVWESGTIKTGDGQNANGANKVRSKNYIPVKPNMVLSVVYASALITVFYYGSEKNYLGFEQRSTLTVPENAYFMRFFIGSSVNPITSLDHNLSINYPATDTSYHAYQGETIPISWQSEAGTVYGGTLDVTSGVLTVEYVSITLDETSWAGDPGDGVLTSADAVLAGRYKPADSGSAARIIYGLSNYYSTSADGNLDNTKIRANGVSTDKLQIVSYKTDFNVSTYQAFLDIMEATPLQIVYRLATPQTYQLTAQQLNTLLGDNNIWADCGDVEVEYPADTKLYIQKINTPTDDDMIADANIASGKYFIVNNNLYLSTAAILAGDPIKPGTNCTATNLAAALNAINS